MNHYLIYLILLFFFQSCKKEVPEPLIITCLSVLRVSYERDHEAFNRVHFTSNALAEFDSFIWDFGDGTTSTSATTDFTHIFPQKDGIYRVSLRGKTPCGDVLQKDTTVTICSSCFEYRAVEGRMNYTAKLNGFPDKILTIYNLSVTGFPDPARVIRINKINSNAHLLYVYGSQVQIGNLNFYLGDTLNKTAFGHPPTGNYAYNATNGNKTASIDIYYGQQGTSGFFSGREGVGNVSIIRSDSLVAGNFAFTFTGKPTDPFSGKPNTTGTSTVNGSFEITKTVRYYYP